MTSLPWTYTERPDTGTTNVRFGMWLFLASEAMFFASLLSAYVLLRTGSAEWPDAAVLGGWTEPLVLTVLLAASTALVAGVGRGSGPLRPWPLVASAGLAAVFVVFTTLEYRAKLDAGLLPSTNLLLACWYTLTAVHAAHVAAGAMANLWVAATSAHGPQAAERHRAMRYYWLLVDVVWVALLISFYVR